VFSKRLFVAEHHRAQTPAIAAQDFTSSEMTPAITLAWLIAEAPDGDAVDFLAAYSGGW
jgi:hypothetical protein